jgi:hypothetical protein
MVRMYQSPAGGQLYPRGMRFSFLEALAELLGMLVGLLLAPVVALRGRKRRRHFFHAEGTSVEAEVVAPPPAGLPERLRPFAQAISGRARARFSWAVGGARKAAPPGAGRKGSILGLGLQLGSAQWPQHLHLATFDWRSRKMTGNPDDFLDQNNVYSTVISLRLRRFGDVYLRVRPLGSGSSAGTAADRLEQITHTPGPHLGLELASKQEREIWFLVGQIHLRRLTVVPGLAPGEIYADPTLSPRSSPFDAGAGLRTLGFLAGVRRILYPVSQRGRRQRAAGTSPSNERQRGAAAG